MAKFSLLDWLYPPKCISCAVILPLGKARRYICAACENLLQAIRAPFCERCGAPLSPKSSNCQLCLGRKFYFTYNRAAFVYEETLRDLINDMKFSEKKRVAHALGEAWAKQVAKHAEEYTGFELVPMPMHPQKKRERGFNQAEIMTHHLSSALQLPISRALVRVVDTPPQSELHPSKRLENVRDIFSVCENVSVHGKNYILTDDIFTTGASLNECAKTLIKSGAAQVKCLTLSVTVKNNAKN
jgi:ComF family protein